MSWLLHALRAVYYIYCTPGRALGLGGGGGAILDVMDHTLLNISRKNKINREFLTTERLLPPRGD